MSHAATKCCVKKGMMRMETNEESRRQLYESRDFIQLARLGHELSDAGVEVEPDFIAAPGEVERSRAGESGSCVEKEVEARFCCRFCGDEVRFRDLAWGLAPQPLWVVAEISGGDPNEDCRARRARRLEHRRVIQTKLLARWKRLRWTATSREHFN